jgi:hypothetical protein
VAAQSVLVDPTTKKKGKGDEQYNELQEDTINNTFEDGEGHDMRGSAPTGASASGDKASYSKVNQ